MGMAPLALLLKSSDNEVFGFDNCPNAEVVSMLEKNGIRVFSDFDKGVNADNFIISTALLSRDFAGREFKQRGQAFADFCSQRKLISVVGSHGKTSVSNMCAYLINKLGLGGIGYMLGAMPSGDYLPAKNCDLGSYILAEIDESDATIENFSPDICCALNFDLDHTNTYATKSDVIAMFDRLFTRTKSLILVPKSSKELCDIAQNHLGKVIFVDTDDSDFDSFNKSMASRLMSVISKREIEIEALRDFTGTKRRQEVLLDNDDILAIGDYAHRPSEIEAFFKWLNKKNSLRKVIFFQPHRYTRTKEFYLDFQKVLLEFAKGSKVYILPVYPASEPFDANATSELISKGTNLELISFDELEDSIKKELSKDKLCLAFVGAGDIYFRAKDLIQKIHYERF